MELSREFDIIRKGDMILSKDGSFMGTITSIAKHPEGNVVCASNNKETRSIVPVNFNQYTVTFATLGRKN